MSINFSKIIKIMSIGIAGIFGVLILLIILWIAVVAVYINAIDHKIIEYDEEVKLHDGTMIWVHIKRHYRGSSGSIASITTYFTPIYTPTEVEISWDTGFEGVGRRSIVFGGQIALIDRYEN
ncbi:MAG: hypothetical protein Q4G13_02940, partial [Moraxella sp.]|nr:hypothetical protein [Moraxella sp.]